MRHHFDAILAFYGLFSIQIKGVCMQGVSNHFQSLTGHFGYRLLRCIQPFIVLLVVWCFSNAVLGAEVGAASSAQSSMALLGDNQIKEQLIQVDPETISIAFQHIADLKEENTLLKQKLDALTESQNAKAQSSGDSSGAVTFPVWTSILLGCVAVIVTTLGVGLAIFAYFGYREAMRRSAEIAKDTAAEVAKSEIIRKMENGEFKLVIEEAIDRVALGSFSAGDDIDER